MKIKNKKIKNHYLFLLALILFLFPTKTDSFTYINTLKIGTFDKVGIGETYPETSLEITSLTPYLTLHNSTHENTDGGMESKIRFKGETGVGTEWQLGEIQVSHDATSADGKGDLKFFTNDGNDADDTLQERMRIDSSGKVGIGTTAPNAPLQTSSADYPVIRGTRTSTVTNAIRAGISIHHETTGNMSDGFGAGVSFDIEDSADVINPIAGVYGVRDGADNSGALHFQNYLIGAAKINMVLDSSGNIGIGTTSPSSILDIEKVGTVSTDNILLELTNTGNAASMGDTGTGIRFNQNYYDAVTPATVDKAEIIAYTDGNWTSTASTQDADLAFKTVLNGTMTEHMRITSSGNVGIGTTTPGTKLEVNGTSKFSSTMILLDGIGLRFGSTIGDSILVGKYGSNKITIEDAETATNIVTFQETGNVGIGTTSPGGTLDISPGTTGGLYTEAAEADANITADHTITIQCNVPSGSKLLGCQLRVDSALAAGETWNAQYVTGSTQSIASNQAVAQNTKVNKFFDENAATAIASDEVDITIQRNSNPGVDAFTAQGNIRAIIYYQGFTAMGDAS